MTDCCEDKACAIDALRERLSSALKTVLGMVLACLFVMSAFRVLRNGLAELRNNAASAVS